MRRLRRTVAAGCGLALLATVGTAGSASAAGPATTFPGRPRVPRPHVSPWVLAVARAGLPARDGWGSAGAGTTGGARADAAHVFVVRNRNQLVAALGGDNATNLTNATPKIVIVAGAIDANTDDAGRPLGCADYADPDYSLEAFLKAYDPATWGRADPSGPLEQARLRSAAHQKSRVQIAVGPNTTILGVHGATLRGGNLLLGTSSHSVSNIIVRNLTFVDAHDCFPEWSPTDGASGNWNSLYDNVTLARATNVWLDHNAFSDGSNTDDRQPVYFGRPYQVHDGLSDIIRGSDLVTVSYNRYADHDKSILVGSTNKPGDPATDPKADLGRLRVTFHHNAFVNLGQRAPRVRFGKVDVFDNYYVARNASTFQYSWGVGVQSSIYAENNFFSRSADVPLDSFIHDWGGMQLTEKGTLVRTGHRRPVRTSLLEAYNAAYAPALGGDAGWVPRLRRHLDPAIAVPVMVSWLAGPGRLGI